MPPELSWCSKRVSFDNIGLDRDGGPTQLIENSPCLGLSLGVGCTQRGNDKTMSSLPRVKRSVAVHATDYGRTAGRGANPKVTSRIVFLRTAYGARRTV